MQKQSCCLQTMQLIYLERKDESGRDRVWEKLTASGSFSGSLSVQLLQFRNLFSWVQITPGEELLNCTLLYNNRISKENLVLLISGIIVSRFQGRGFDSQQMQGFLNFHFLNILLKEMSLEEGTITDIRTNVAKHFEVKQAECDSL